MPNRTSKTGSELFAELTAVMAVVDKARRAAQEHLAAINALPAALLRQAFHGNGPPTPGE